MVCFFFYALSTQASTGQIYSNIYVDQFANSYLCSFVASAPSRRVSETIEVRHERGPSPVPVRIVRPGPPPERVERIVVEERRETRRERSRGGSDEVVVIEDHSPPRRSGKSKRESRGGRM